MSGLMITLTGAKGKEVSEMAKEYYIYEDEHDGQGWFRPLGKIKMYREECLKFIEGQHYARHRDITELGYWYPEPDFKLVEAN